MIERAWTPTSANDSQLVLGLAAPVGLTRAAPDFGAFLYFSFEHRFAKGE